MPLTDADFALFEPSRVDLPHIKPRREPIRQVKPPQEEPRESKDERALRVWRQSLVAYAVSGIVGLCLFMVVQSEAAHHSAMVQQQALYRQLELAQQRNISAQAELDRKYSLDIIQEVAMREYHMVPIEGGRVVYLNIERGDQRID